MYSDDETDYCTLHLRNVLDESSSSVDSNNLFDIKPDLEALELKVNKWLNNKLISDTSGNKLLSALKNNKILDNQKEILIDKINRIASNCSSKELDEVNEHLLQYDLSDKNIDEFLTIVEKIAKSYFHVVPHPFSTEGRSNPKNENKNAQDI
ncbi:hypothetical protein L3V83_11170 [Thiotrichales bacterium 19X7-9]|nr:hypothetical protein [Thiotrichales bacterium 19X7-9]